MNESFRRIRDEIVRSFLETRIRRWCDTYRTEAVAAIQNKIRPFLTNTNMRAIVSQPGRSLDLRQVMDEGKILIVNLSKGRIGEDNATLLGAFLVTSIQQAAMTRADIPEDQRRDFFLYVDEFQNFTTGGFASVLSEARKFRLSLTVAHQYLVQFNEATANAVWGNVGSIIAFQIGSDDAEVIAQQLSKYRGQLQPQDFTEPAEVHRLCPTLDRRHAEQSVFDENPCRQFRLTKRDVKSSVGFPGASLRSQYTRCQRAAPCSTIGEQIVFSRLGRLVESAAAWASDLKVPAVEFVIHLIEERDFCALGFVVLILFVVGKTMTQHQPAQQVWGMRLAAAVFAVVTVHRIANAGISNSSQLLWCVITGLVTAALFLGPAWIVLAMLGFAFGYWKTFEAKARARADTRRRQREKKHARENASNKRRSLLARRRNESRNCATPKPSVGPWLKQRLRLRPMQRNVVKMLA